MRRVSNSSTVFDWANKAASACRSSWSDRSSVVEYTWVIVVVAWVLYDVTVVL